MKRSLIGNAFGLAVLSAGVMRSTRFDKPDTDPNESSFVLDKKSAETVVLGVETIQKEQKTLKEKFTSDIGNLSKTAKDLQEDITKLKNHGNDTQGRYDELSRKMRLLDARVQYEMRSAIGDPIARIERNEELRMRLNCAIRVMLSKEGDFHKRLKHQLKALGLDGKKIGDDLRVCMSDDELHARALGEDSSPGSTLIDDQLAKEIYDTLTSFGIWSTFGVRNVGTKQTKYPLKTARPVANFVLTEGDAIGDDANKAGGSVTLEVEVLAVLLNVSLQLLEDSEFDVTRDILNDFAEALAYRLDYASVLGDGTADATNGGMTGILNAWTAANAAAGNSTIEATQLEDWQRVLLTVDPIVLTRMAKWWMHPQTLIRSLAIRDLSGRPLFQTALEAPSTTGIGSILGYPVQLGYIFPTTNAANAKPVAFGDPESHIIGIRRNFVTEASDHHKWNTLQRSFRGWGRAGVKTRSATGGSYLKLSA